eukprot:gene4693-3386_t
MDLRQCRSVTSSSFPLEEGVHAISELNWIIILFLFPTPICSYRRKKWIKNIRDSAINNCLTALNGTIEEYIYILIRNHNCTKDLGTKIIKEICFISLFIEITTQLISNNNDNE